MTDRAIPDLPAIAQATSADLLHVVQGGKSRRATLQQLAAVLSVPGPDGRPVELTRVDDAILWHWEGDVNWTELLKLEDIKGDKGDTGDISDTLLEAVQNAIDAARVSDERASDAAGAARAAGEHADRAERGADTATRKASDSDSSARTAAEQADRAERGADTATQKAADADGFARAAGAQAERAESQAESATQKAADAEGSARDAQASANSILGAVESAAASAAAAGQSERIAAEHTDRSEEAAGTSSRKAREAGDAATAAGTQAERAERAASTATDKASEANRAVVTAGEHAEYADLAAGTAIEKAGDAERFAEAAKTSANSILGAEQSTADNAAAAERSATNAAEQADRAERAASSVDNSSFVTKAGNGSDFADPLAVRSNIGAAAEEHGHGIGDIEGLADQLDTKASTAVATVDGKGLMSADDKRKLADIAAGATVNASDAELRDRERHTGEQAISTVAGLQAALDGKASKAIATTSANGLMSTGDKQKLGDIAAGATANASDAALRDRGSHTGEQAISTITGLQAALSGKQASLGYAPEDASRKGAANGYAGLDASGKLLPSVLPALAITDIFEVGSQAAMLALTAQIGDIAIRTDLSKTFALAAEPASIVANWKELRTPADVVQSVAGLTGPITAAALKLALSLSKADVGLSKVADLAPNEMPVSTDQAAAIGTKLNSADLDTARAWTKRQRQTPVPLASGASINVDLAAAQDFDIAALAHNATLTFTNAANAIGQKGTVTGKNNGSGGFAMAFGAGANPIGRSTAPSIPTGPNARWRIDYHVRADATVDFSVSSVGA